VHAPQDQMFTSCQWEGCTHVRRSRASLLFHLRVGSRGCKHLYIFSCNHLFILSECLGCIALNSSTRQTSKC
jgi:hypothetical protein